MFPFTSMFRSVSADIVTRLTSVREELNDAQASIRILIENQPVVVNGCGDCLLSSAFRQFGVAIWAKDTKGCFTFVNDACCSEILHCTKEEALGHIDCDFEENALAVACLGSEGAVMGANKTKRFIECGMVKGKFMALDTVKSPVSQNGTITGTIGTGGDITAMISDPPTEPVCVEIPMHTILTKEKLVEVLRGEYGTD